jgi:phosphonate transport system ATP-binding protein
MLDRALERAERLSGGQQQRVAIARALMQEPKLILADEPVASLDPQNSQVVMDTLSRINAEHGIPVLCNLHDVDLARQYMGRVIGLKAGEVVFDGPPSRLTDAALASIYGAAMEVASTSRAA